MFVLETHEGTAYERGLDHGSKFRHVIQSNLHCWAFRQPFQGSEEDMERTVAPLRKVVQERFPETFDELRGIADGSGADYRWLERMEFRIWNRLAREPLKSPGCTGVGLVTRDRGTVVSGTLDDPRQCYVLACSRPTEGRAYLRIRWAGTTWGHNGVNESGLAIAQQSLGGFDKPVPSDPAGTALSSISTGYVLKECDTVADALAYLEGCPSVESLIIGVRSGELVEVCHYGEHLFVRRPDTRNMVWNSNLIHNPEALAFGSEHGATPTTSNYSLTRHGYLAGCADSHGGDFSYSDAEEILRSLDGYPNSVCNEGTVMASIAPVQDEPGVIYIADKPPSVNEFVRYDL
jgi:hypothetical protein